MNSLLRLAALDGRQAVEDIWRGQFEVLAGGKVMTTVSATNKSFSFTLPQGGTPGDITVAADKALAWIDSHTSDELAAFITRRSQNVAAVRFC